MESAWVPSLELRCEGDTDPYTAVWFVDASTLKQMQEAVSEFLGHHGETVDQPDGASAVTARTGPTSMLSWMISEDQADGLDALLSSRFGQAGQVS